ncbi:MAG: iron-containing alcohol dehydrogenase [Arenibacterium sp.]
MRQWRFDQSLMGQAFSFHVPTQVQFGDGASAGLPDLLPPDVRHVAFLQGASGVAAGPIVERLEQAGIRLTKVACRGEPSVTTVNEAVQLLRAGSIDAVVACGGGSVIDSAKAVAFCLGHDLRLTEDFSEVPSALLNASTPLPLIAIPTTAGTGAEVTANAVLDLPSRGAKVSLRGRALQPDYALVDPLLLPSAPKATILASGLDAVAQTIEAFTSNAATPFSDALTAPNVARGLVALQAVMETRESDAWRDLAWVSLSSGVALANSGLGAAHGLASVLGGRYGAPHGALCGRLLVPVLRQNLARAVSGSDTKARLETCAATLSNVFPPLPGQDVFSGFNHWQREHGLPRLADMGVTPEALPDLATQSAGASSSKRNAVVLSPEDYEIILRAAL